MDFNEILLMVFVSVFSGLIGGLVVWWSFNGVHVLGKGFKFENTFLERYGWKYPLITAITLLFVIIISFIAYLLFKIRFSTNFLLTISILLLVFIIITAFRRFR